MAFLSVIVALLSVQGCDSSIDLDNEFDSSITIGNFFEKNLEPRKFILEDLVSIEDIIDTNDLDPETTWDDIEASNVPLIIPNMTFGPFEMDSFGLSESDIDLLAGSGDLFVNLKAVSTLPVDVDINIDFITPDGAERLNEEPVTIQGSDDGIPGQNEEEKFEITESLLRSMARATGIGGEIENQNLLVRLRRGDFVELMFTVEKTGGIDL